MNRLSETDQQLAALSDGQEGVFARWQLAVDHRLRCAIDHRVRMRRLVVVYPGVYAYGHRCLTADGHRLAAALAYGPTAVVSHVSAAVAWELLSSDQRRVDITVPGTSRRPRAGIRLHRARELRPDEITMLNAVPVTTVTRTLCDLAGTVAVPRLRRAVEQAERNGTLNLPALRAAIERHPTRRGTAALRALVDNYTPMPFTRSELERRFLELIAAAGLPAPLVNVRVAGYEVDMYWPQWRLVVELDGRAYHSDPRTFESDPIRDARLQRAGLRVLRVTWKRLVRSPRAMIGDIRALAALAETP